MSVTEAIDEIQHKLLGISVPVCLKEEITEPILDAVKELTELREAVERLSKADREEKENLRKLNQELAEKVFGKTAEEQGGNDDGEN